MKLPKTSEIKAGVQGNVPENIIFQIYVHIADVENDSPKTNIRSISE